MLAQSMKRSLAAAALAIVLVALTSITGAAQDNSRGQRFGRDARVTDNLDGRQQREKRFLKENLKQDKPTFTRERREKRESFLQSQELRQLKRQDQAELRRFKRQDQAELLRLKRQDQAELRQLKRADRQSFKRTFKSRVWQRR